MATKTKNPPARKTSRQPKVDDAPTWRRMTLAEAFDDDFDLPQGVLAALTNLGVKTCGELADRLLANNTFGLKLIEVQALCESIETMSSDDNEPVKFNEVTEEESAFITCPTVAGNTNAAAKVESPIAVPFTPEELAAYDAETQALVSQAAEAARLAELNYGQCKAEASDAKKRSDEKHSALVDLIRHRSENRGKRPKTPEPTLLDVLPKWKNLPLSTIEIRPELLVEFTKENIANLGELDELINDATAPWSDEDSKEWNITLDEVANLREKLKAVIETETAAPLPSAESDLYKQYPIERFTRFGLTSKDVEKLHACETKGTATGFPIITIGDLQRFITPNAASPGYVQSLKDIKGIGDAGCDRIEEAQMQFWGWWRSGGEAEFAAEMAGNAAARE